MFEWTFPGTFWHKALWLNVLDDIEPSVFYDGVNCCSWNGGRLNVFGNLWDDEIAKKFYLEGHRIALTFSNSEIDTEDILGNELLENLSKVDGNQVILKNEKLRQYIDRNFSNLIKVLSVTGTQSTYSKMWYEDALSKYDIIVPRFSHLANLSKDFSKRILGRFEVMVNHICPLNTPICEAHYAEIERMNREGNTSDVYLNKTIECRMSDERTEDLRESMDVLGNVGKAVALGFNRFKLAGRELPIEFLKYQYGQIEHLVRRKKNEILYEN